MDLKTTILNPVLGKYCEKYVDKYDKIYAKTINSLYVKINESVRDKFDTFSEDLMGCEYITRVKLLDAIEAFEAKYGIPDDFYWKLFHDGAFNCRPYQPMF
jgi:hypothetical protein